MRYSEGRRDHLFMAYDNVWRNGFWYMMRKLGMEKNLCILCEGLFNGVEARIVLDKGQSRWFVLEKGFRQWYP